MTNEQKIRLDTLLDILRLLVDQLEILMNQRTKIDAEIEVAKQLLGTYKEKLLDAYSDANIPPPERKMQ